METAVLASLAKSADKKGKKAKSEKDLEAEELDEFRMYADYQELFKKIRRHRILALNRGEHLEALRVEFGGGGRGRHRQVE